VNLTVTTPCPRDYLVLVSLEHDDGTVSKGSTTDCGIGIIGHVLEVTRYDMICDEIRECGGVLGDITRYAGD